MYIYVYIYIHMYIFKHIYIYVRIYATLEGCAYCLMYEHGAHVHCFATFEGAVVPWTDGRAAAPVC